MKTTVQKPALSHLVTGFVTNFFDTLGIGSFATTTAIFKFRNMVPDELYPGTLNVGHTLPTIFQAIIYVAVIEVDLKTLVLLIASAVAGAWFGAGFVAKLPRRSVQIGMGAALITAAVAMLMKQLALFPAGGMALESSFPGNDIQFAVWRGQHFGNRFLRAVHDNGEPSGHESHSRVSNHDGIFGVPYAGCKRTVHRKRRLLFPGCDGACRRRDAGCSAGSVCG